MSADNKIFDALIIGGGPAGVSCSIWLARLGFEPVLVDAKPQVGGLCRENPFVDDWNASLPGKTGLQVADNLIESLDQAGVPVRLSCSVHHISRTEFGFAAIGEGLADPIRARHVVLATGVRARPLGRASLIVPGVLVGPGARIVAQDFRGKRVAVLGGGDNAFENALYASEHGADVVHIYARNIRAQQQFVRKIPTNSVSVGGYDVDTATRSVNGVSYDLILVFYGWEPCVSFADSLGLHRSAQGFIATDMQTAQTSFPGVYAIGEVAQRQHPCVVTALADGVTAAKAIQAKIEAGQ